MEAIREFGRKLKIKYFFRYERNSYSKNQKTFTYKSNWVPADKVTDPDLLECISNYTKEIGDLNIFKEKSNLSSSERVTLNRLRRNKNIVFKKADKGSVIVIMDKNGYIAEGTRQLNNTAHYEKLDAPIYPNTAKLVSAILHKLKSSGVISEKQLNYLLPPAEPRPRYFYMLPKIHKEATYWTVPNQMPPGRPIVSDCNSETKKVSSFIDNYLKRYATCHPSYIKNTYDFVDKIKNLTLPKEYILITLDVESMYTNIDHAKGLQAVREVLTPCVIYDSVIELLDLSLKSNDFMFNGEWYIQKVGTSMGRDWAPHYADIYMAKFEKEALQKCPLKPHTYYRYLDDIFIIWPHSMAAFSEFLNIFNAHEPPIKFKSSVSRETINFLDTTVFADPNSRNNLLTKVYFKPTDTHQMLHKRSFHPKHTFKGLIKSQIMRFFRICSKYIDFDEAWHVYFQALAKRNYSKRWLRGIKGKTVRELQINQRRTNMCFPTTSRWGSKPCGADRCLTCAIISQCPNIKSHFTGKTYGILGNIDCSSSNVIYSYQCRLCDKQYVGETGSSLRVRANGHRFTIKGKHPLSSLYSHLQDHIDGGTKYFIPSLSEYILTPIEKIPTTGSDWQDRINRLKRETFWIDTLGSLEPKGLNKKRSEDVINSSKKDDNATLVIPFSRTGHEASRIIHKHFRLLQSKSYLEHYQYGITTAYTKHKNISNSLVSSKLK